MLNRSELIHDESGIEYWSEFRLEPEFLVVVLASLVQSGDAVLSIPGKKLDASSLEQLVRIGLDELLDFKHIERPKGIPLPALQELFILLGIAPGLVVNEATRDQAVRELGVSVARHVQAAVGAQQVLDSGMAFWSKPVLSDRERDEWAKRLASWKGFLESLQPFNTEGKLKNFPHDAASVQNQKADMDLVDEISGLADVLRRLEPATSYLSTAEALLPTGHPWLEELRVAQAELFAKLGDAKHRGDASIHATSGTRLAALKNAYQDGYDPSREAAILLEVASGYQVLILSPEGYDYVGGLTFEGYGLLGQVRA